MAEQITTGDFTCIYIYMYKYIYAYKYIIYLFLFIFTYIPGTQLTLVLLEKGLVVEGSNSPPK